MPPEKDNGLPFVTRKMLDFEQGVAFTLRVSTQSSVAIELTVRGMTRAGVFTFKHSDSGDSTVQVSNFRIPDMPIFVTVNDPNNLIWQGSTYVVADIVANGDIIQQLISGLVYAQKSISWPNTQLGDLRPGGGEIVSVASADPAAGLNASITVPTGQTWRPIFAAVSVVTDATVVSRRVALRIETLDGQFIDSISGNAQTAGTTKGYSFAQYGVIATVEDSSVIVVPLPSNILLTAGQIIRTSVSSLQAGDNIGIMRVQVERWLQGTNA